MFISWKENSDDRGDSINNLAELNLCSRYVFSLSARNTALSYSVPF